MIVGGTLATFFVVVFLFGKFNAGVEFFPETEPRQIVVDVEMPSGTRLEETDLVVQEIERRMADLPDINVIAASTGARFAVSAVSLPHIGSTSLVTKSATLTGRHTPVATATTLSSLRRRQTLLPIC